MYRLTKGRLLPAAICIALLAAGLLLYALLPEKDAIPPVPTVSLTAVEDEDGVLAFDTSMEDYVGCYNALYRHQGSGSGFAPPEDWNGYDSATVTHGLPAVRYWCSEDTAVTAMPTLALCTPYDRRCIYEIEMTFDHHSYQTALYELFKQECFCMLKIALPDFTDEEVWAVYQTLYAEKEDNFWGGDTRPPLTVLYYHGSVGFYGYYGAGTANLCLIPVTEESLSRWQDAGAEVRRWEDLR